MLALVLLIPAVSASIQLDGISTDPAIIAAGDSVDVIVEYSTGSFNDRFATSEYRFAPRLIAGDAQTSEYVTISDPQGISRFATLPAGATRTQVFRIKVSEQAPADKYSFELIGEWTRNGVVEQAVLSERFFLDVKREAIVLSVSDVRSDPQRLLPGTREATLHVQISNSGSKDAFDVRLHAEMPENITSSFASSTRSYVGSVASGSVQHTTLTVDLHEALLSGEHEIEYTLMYRDDSQNAYETRVTAPLFISEKPLLRVESMNSTLVAGREATLSLRVHNHGVVAAEAIDVRLLTESNQPFDLSTRSAYIGKLYPNESTTVHLRVAAQQEALAGEYNIPVLLRATGDSNHNDNTVYTFRERAVVSVHENNKNFYAAIGLVAVLLLAGLFVWRKYR